MSIHRYILAALPLSLVLMSCTAPGATKMAANAEAEKPDPRRGEEVKSLCYGGRISGFGETTRNSVVIRQGRKNYLLETYNGCLDLEYAQSLSLNRFSGCLSRGDRLIGFDSPFGHDNFGPRSQPCTIKTIYEWDKDATETETPADGPTEETTAPQ